MKRKSVFQTALVYYLLSLFFLLYLLSLLLSSNFMDLRWPVSSIPFSRETVLVFILIGLIILFLTRLFILTIRNEKVYQSSSEREHHLKLLINSSQDALALLDEKNETILEANKSFVEHISLDTNQLLGEPLSNIVPQRFILRYRRNLVRAIASKMRLEFLQNSHGKVYWNTLQPIFDKEGFTRKVVLLSRDVTHEKNVEEDLRETSKSYRELSENSPLGILVHRDNKVQHVNSMAMKILGVGCPCDLVGKNIYELIAPEYHVVAYQMIHKTYFKNRQEPFELKFTKQDGSEIFVEGSGRDITFRGYPAAQLFFGEVTHKKHAEAALKRSEEIFRKFFRRNSAPILLINPEDGSIEDSNLAACRFYGYPERVMRSMTIFNINMLSQKEVKNQMDKALKQVRNHFIFHHRLASGQIKDVETYSTPINTGEETLLFSIIHDITRRKRAEDLIRKLNENLERKVILRTQKVRQVNEALLTEIGEREKVEKRLKRSHDFLTSVINALSENIAILNHQGVIIQVNEAWNKFWQKNGGDKKYSFIGMNYLTVLEESRGNYSEEASYVAGEIREMIRGRKWNLSMEYPCLSEESFRWFKMSANLFENVGQVYIVIAHTDISERKQAEENIYRSLEKEQELNQMKSRFISMVTHEFRTPLTNIFTSAQILQRYDNQMDRSKKDTQFARIIESVRILQSMLEEVSLFSKRQDNRLNLKWVPVEIKSFFQSMVDEIISTFSRSIHIQFSMRSNPEVAIDKSLLRHITANLLTNAVKYSNDEVVINVKLRENQKLIITVKDQGRGIPGKDLNHIFDPFFRSSNAGSVSGTGLGLSIVRQCVDLLGGEIDVKSTLNHGTLVEVCIPYQKTQTVKS